MGVIAKQSIRGTIVTYLGVAVGFVTTFFVITRFLTAEEIGLARVMIDAATLFIGLAQLGTNASILRFYPYFLQPATSRPNSIEEDGRQSEHGFFFWTLIVPMVGFIIVALLFVACYGKLSAWFAEKSPLFVDYYYLVIPLAFFMLYQTVFETNANVRMHIVIPRAVRELLTRIGLLIAYLLLAFKFIDIDGFIISLIAIYALAAVCNAGYLFSLGGVSLMPDMHFLRMHPDIVSKYLRYTGFLVLSAIASFLAPTLSSFFVTAKMGLNFTGIFAIATYMAVMVSIPYRSLTAIASPQLSLAMKENKTDEASTLIRQVSSNLLLVGGFILALIWVNIDLIFALLPNGSTYAVARTVVLLLGITQLLIATFQFALTALSYSRYYAYSLLCSLLLTVLALVLNNRLIPRFGMEGAAMASLIAQAVYFVVVLLIVRLTTKCQVLHRQHAKILLLLSAIFLINEAWCYCLPHINLWADSLLRSLVILGSSALIAYKTKLSPEINDAILHRLRI